jgi:nitroreductase
MLVDELLKIIGERRSIREFTQESISDEEIHLLLEAAHLAPSNSNRQAWKFLVVKNLSIKRNMAEAVEKKILNIRQALNEQDLIESFDNYTRYLTFFQNAPLIIIALFKQSFSFLEDLLKKINLASADRKVNSELMSVSMAIQNLQLAAHTLGIGTCCMTGPLIAANEIKNILDVRPPFEIAAIIPVGRYSTLPTATSRKNIKSISETIE